MVYLLLAARWILAVVFTAAGVAKLNATGGRDETERAITRYRALPHRLVGPAARVLPWLEVTLAVLLAAGVALKPAAVVAATLLASFALAIVWHVAHGRRFGCGCGSAKQISWPLAARDILLAGLAATVAAGPSGALAAWPTWGNDPASPSWRALLAVPLTVILATTGLRLYNTSRPTRAPNTIRQHPAGSV